MKSLFNDDVNNSYTEMAQAVENELHPKLMEIFEMYTKLGYSPREISYCLQNAVRDAELGCLLNSSESRFDKYNK